MAVGREYFKHDIGSLMDGKLDTLVNEYGAEGYAVYFLCLEYLYRDRGEPISDRLIQRVAFELKMTPEKVKEILDYAASERCGGMLLKTEEGYSSGRVIKAIEEREEERQKKSRAGKKGMANRWEKRD